MMRMILATVAALAATACSPSPQTPAANDTTAVIPDGGMETSSSSDAAPNIAAPQRSFGLWTFTKVAANGDELNTDSLCVGERSEARYSAFQQIGNGGTCTSRSFTKTATGYTYVTVCGVPDMKPVTTRGTLTGDIATGYTLEEVLDLSVEGDHQKIVAKHIGQCPTGMTDGQMKDGQTGAIYSVLLR